MIVYDQKERCSEFIQKQLGERVCWGEWYEAIGLELDGEIIAAALYSLMTDYDCAMHFAGSNPKWLQPEFINVIFRYPFIQMGLRRVTSYTYASNARALSLVNAFGFVYEGTLRKAGKDEEDVIILGLLKEECKYGK